ncbi:MAG: hypothetical protein GXP49_14375 [Deltaproteobacteria bacterium]|nr:hypothetical protein [Deltaproteobacteria bacterium]
MENSKTTWETPRRFPRLRYRVQVRYSSPNISVLEETVNIGPGGAFINSKLWDAVGAKADLRFFIPGRSNPIACKGIVRWTPLDDEILFGKVPKHAGMGVEFLEGGEEIGKALKETLRDNTDQQSEDITFTPPVLGS